MASLKDIRRRIRSVQATRKITSAMMMVSSAKLRRAQHQLEKAKGFREGWEELLTETLSGLDAEQCLNPLLITRPGRILILLGSSDRGLAGGFNVNLFKAAKEKIEHLQKEEAAFSIFPIGKKAYDFCLHRFPDHLWPSTELSSSTGNAWKQAQGIAQNLLEGFLKKEITKVIGIYAIFKSVISQPISEQTLLPFAPTFPKITKPTPPLTFDPQNLLSDLLVQALRQIIFDILLNLRVSEEAARTMAMDGATRNATEMIDKLTLLYNRQRQSLITKELVEIISGSEAV